MNDDPDALDIDLSFVRGPLPRHLLPTPIRPGIVIPTPAPPKPRPQPRPQRPTEWVEVAENTWIIENPNVCSICHRAFHGPTAHHSFDPDRASVTVARALGWPMPPNQE